MSSSSTNTIPQSICQSCIRLLATSNTPSCDASATTPTCTKCALLKHTCKPVPAELNLQLTDLIYFHSRWRRAVDGGDKGVAAKAKAELGTRVMDFIDELEDLEAKTNASGGPSGGSSDVSKSVPVTPPQTPVLGRKQAKVPSSVGGKQGAGVVKKPAVPRTAKPKAQAQTKAKLEKALTSSASKNSKSKSRSSTPPTTANVLRASNVATVMTDNLGSGLDMTPHAPIFALSHSHTPSYAQESSYSMPMPPPALGPPFGHVDTFDADTTHLDSSNISNINNFLDFPPIDSSSSTNDYPSLMAPPTTPMTSFQLGNGHVNMQGAGGGGGGAGMEFSGDVGLRILDQLQTLNTTMSGMYEMMRRQAGS